MNGEEYFASLLNEIESELTNLKTSHYRPLGALNFFRANQTLAVDASGTFGAFKVKVTITKPIKTPPIVQFGWSTPPGYYHITLEDEEVSADYTVWTYSMGLYGGSDVTDLPVEVVSSQPIESIEVEYL